ncbi:uncharacterized protein [Nicotiana tomentosiformis]|uniref:uncharacterized protein n=1 Tax=Nicotiana tomentosiformis TaxID=4098 RepID=UPI00388CB7B8
MWLDLQKENNMTIIYHSANANVVDDALSRKAGSMGSLSFIPVGVSQSALYVESLANKFVRMNILEPSRVLSCIVSWSSFFERIKAHQYDDPYLVVLKDTVQHGDAKEVTIGDDRVLRM